MEVFRGLIKIHKGELGLAARDLIKTDLTIVPAPTSSFHPMPDPVRLWIDDGDHLYVPRGYYNKVIKKRFDPKIEFKWSSGAAELRPNPEVSYRPGQKETIDKIVETLKAHDFGGAICEAPTGSGKTVLSMETARRLGMKTLFVVHTTVLLEQWKEAISKFMPNWSVGVIRGDTCDVGNNDVCVAMLQSLALGSEYPEAVYDEFGFVVFDECLDSSTLISTPRGPVKISDLIIGESIFAPDGKLIRVTAKKKVIKKAYQYEVTGGMSLIASDDHKVPTFKKLWNDGKKIVTRGRGCRLEVSAIKDATNLVLPSSVVSSGGEDLQAELVGWFLGDGTNDRGYVKFAFRKEAKIEAFRSLLLRGLFPYREFKNARGDAVFHSIGTLDELCAAYGFGPGKKANTARIPDELFLSPSIVSVLRGLFDTDGGMEGGYIKFCSSSIELAKQVQLGLAAVGIFSTIGSYKRKIEKHANRVVVSIGSTDSIVRFRDLIGFRVENKRKALDGVAASISGRSAAGVAIVSRTPVGYRELWDIEVDSDDRLFVANGFAVHNCHLVGAEEFKKALFRFRSRYILGVSGTLKRKDRADNVFKYGTGEVVSAMTAIEILKPLIYFVNTSMVWNEGGDDELDRQKNPFLKAIVQDDARNELIIQNAVKAAQAGRHVLVLSERVGHVETLYREILKRLYPIGIKVGMMVGTSSKEQRAAAQVAQVIVATVQLLAVGFDNPRLDTMIMATPIQSLDQAVGRILRQHPDKKMPMVIDLVDTKSDIGKIFGRSRLSRYRFKKWETKGEQCLK